MNPCVSGSLLCLVALLSASPSPAADSVTIAAAANLVYALDPIDSAFARVHPGIALRRESGASGDFVVQIENGAPYDVFLSADMDFPRKLAAAGAADPGSLRVFAVGRLVLWTTRPDLPLDSIAATVRNPAVRRLAIANPETAPYGRAAREALARLGASAVAEPKLVVGESIGQAAQYVESGNADAGFVALSLVLSPKLRDRGRWIEVPAGLCSPIRQGAMLTLRGRDNPSARLYLEFLLSPAAREILGRFGYGLPP